MPELPEVAALVTQLDEELRGAVIARMDVPTFSALKTFDPPVSALGGLPIDGVRRIGKHIVIDVSGLHIVVHLMRAGWMSLRAIDPDQPTKRGKGPLAVRIVLAEGQALDITDASTQKKVAVHVVRDVDDVPSIARLGPDPLTDDVTLANFAALLDAAGRTQIKRVLRDQSVLAGIGNAYSDEILHAAKLSPFAAASGLDEAERQRLYDAMLSTLTEAVDRARGVKAGALKDDKRTHMNVHGRTGESCPECGDVIREVVYSDSSLQYCATCQTGGKPLKDRSTSKFLK
jgi:formamidopyrimidine-DNA glycosylase